MTSAQPWRDLQLAGFNSFSPGTTILEQEQIMIKFMSSCGDISWRWAGTSSQLKNICSNRYKISDLDYKGIIIFGKTISNVSTSELVTIISNLIQPVDYAYVAINRYQLTRHDLSFDLPDSIADSLDTIMKYCHPKFQRLHSFIEVDGDHMVGAHPMDCYGLCK
jgi:hypothetical protein